MYSVSCIQMTKECITKLIRFWFEDDYSFTIMSYDGLVYTIPKTTVENRICKQCNCEAVEDEEHLLIKCNKYSFARNTFFSNINNNFFKELSDRNKFIWLLSNEDREICKNLANFIATCLSIRDLSDK